jgi:hypothetical protein
MLMGTSDSATLERENRGEPAAYGSVTPKNAA